MMITVKELSKERNITPQAVQKKALRLGIEKRNGKYIFTNDELEQMYGERFPGLNKPTNQPENNYYQLENNYYQKPTNENQHYDQHDPDFFEMMNNCHSKLVEINHIIISQTFQNEELEQARQNLTQSIADLTTSFKKMYPGQPTHNQVESIVINANDLIVE